MQDILQRAQKIKLVLFDVDGVLTDGGLFFGDDGQEYKAFYSRDGLGIKLLQRTGVEVGVITARQSQLVVHRMKNLGIEHFYQGHLDKTIAFREILEKRNACKSCMICCLSSHMVKYHYSLPRVKKTICLGFEDSRVPGFE